jgi:hypothetical protein
MSVIDGPGVCDEKKSVTSAAESRTQNNAVTAALKALRQPKSKWNIEFPKPRDLTEGS